MRDHDFHDKMVKKTIFEFVFKNLSANFNQNWRKASLGELKIQFVNRRVIPPPRKYHYSKNTKTILKTTFK